VLSIARDYDAFTISMTLQDLKWFALTNPRVWDGSWLVGSGTFGYT
jgi:hypothetical protein